jgi:predicted nuclease of predicted toxin-antitoxin system
VTIWVDAQLSPAIAEWINLNFSVSAVALRDLGLRDATDHAIFFAARAASAILMTKDSDFLRLLHELGSPPKIIWLTCGNTSNARLRQILTKALPQALSLLQSEQLVEINSD